MLSSYIRSIWAIKSYSPTFLKKIEFIFFVVALLIYFKLYRHYGFDLYQAFLTSICISVSTIILIRIPGRFGLIAKAYFSVVLALCISSVIFTKSFLSPGIVASFFETDMKEFFGMLEQMKFAPIILFVLLFFLMRAVAAKVGKTAVSWKMIVLFAALNLTPIVINLVNKNLWDDSPFKSNAVKGNLHYTCELMLPNIIASPPCLSRHYFYEKRKLLEYNIATRSLPVGVSLIKETSKESETPVVKIIFIIGESGAKSHYAAYDYAFGTDNFLASFKMTNNASFIVNDAVSPASLTRESVIRMLSFASPTDANKFYKFKNLVELANEANHQTTWISNQRRVGEHDTLIGAIANSSHKSIFIQEMTKGLAQGLDIKVIKPFQNELKLDDSNQLIFVHLIGSHQPYNDKYDEIDWKAASKSPQVDRPYDASVHHTDSVIKSIYETVRNHKSWLIVYVPDHGENLLNGHGYFPIDRLQFEVPLVILGEASAVKSLKKSIIKFTNFTGTFNTSNLIYVVGELLGYQYTDELIKEAIHEGDFVFHVDAKSYALASLKH